MRLVAPCVGAWIEIENENITSGNSMSPPVWGRGLKYVCNNMDNLLNMSPPVWGQIEMLKNIGF